MEDVTLSQKDMSTKYQTRRVVSCLLLLLLLLLLGAGHLITSMVFCEKKFCSANNGK